MVSLLEDVSETLRHSVEAILAALALTNCNGLVPFHLIRLIR